MSGRHCNETWPYLFSVSLCYFVIYWKITIQRKYYVSFTFKYLRLRDFFFFKTSKTVISEVGDNEIKKKEWSCQWTLTSAGAPLSALMHPKEERASPTPLSETWETCLLVSSFYRNATQKKQCQNYTEMALEKKNFHSCFTSYSENGGNMPRSAKSSML